MKPFNKTLELICHRYRLCVERDDFSSLTNDEPVPHSVASFLAFLIAAPLRENTESDLPPMIRAMFAEIRGQVVSTLPLVRDLSMPLGKLLELDLKGFDERKTMADLFCSFFAGPLLKPLIESVVDSQPGDPPGIQDQIREELSISNRKDFERIVARRLDETIARQMVDELFAIFCEVNRSKCLKDFFQVRRNGGFYGRPEMSNVDVGKRLAELKADINSPAQPGSDRSLSDLKVRVVLSTFDELDPPCPVTGLYWEASLISAGSPDVPLATADGFLYIFEREDGKCLGDEEDLGRAAQVFAGVGLQQVSFFVNEHADAAELMEKSDLCFCSKWERAETAPRGTGAILLNEATKLLVKKYRRLRTLVLDSRPMQYREWESALKIPDLATEIQASIESLTQYAASVKPDKIEIRYIFNRLAGMPELSQEIDRHANMLERQRSSGRCDYHDVSEQIRSIFEMAGMDELAYRVESGHASDLEVRNVLTVLLLQRRIPYIPLSSGAFHDAAKDPSALRRESLEDIEEYADDDEVAQFLFRLPDDCAVDGIALDDAGDVIIAVSCEILAEGGGVYELQEHFTTQQVPPPVDVSSLLRRLQD